MWKIQDLESMINKHAGTNVSMKGKIDENGEYLGSLEGSTTEDLYAFVAFIAKERNEAFERVNFRLKVRDPLTYDCVIKFDTKALKPEKGFFKKLFG